MGEQSRFDAHILSIQQRAPDFKYTCVSNR